MRLSITAYDGNLIQSFDAPFPAIDPATIWGWGQGNVVAARYAKDRNNGQFVINHKADVLLWRVIASRIRYFTDREYARLPTFPDDWVFVGKSKRDIHRQIGNQEFLLSLYGNIHSSDKCFAVLAAKNLIEAGIDPEDREELTKITKA